MNIDDSKKISTLPKAMEVIIAYGKLFKILSIKCRISFQQELYITSKSREEKQLNLPCTKYWSVRF